MEGCVSGVGVCYLGEEDGEGGGVVGEWGEEGAEFGEGVGAGEVEDVVYCVWVEGRILGSGGHGGAGMVKRLNVCFLELLVEKIQCAKLDKG